MGALPSYEFTHSHAVGCKKRKAGPSSSLQIRRGQGEFTSSPAPAPWDTWRQLCLHGNQDIWHSAGGHHLPTRGISATVGGAGGHVRHALHALLSSWPPLSWWKAHLERLLLLITLITGVGAGLSNWLSRPVQPPGLRILRPSPGLLLGGASTGTGQTQQNQTKKRKRPAKKNKGRPQSSAAHAAQASSPPSQHPKKPKAPGRRLGGEVSVLVSNPPVITNSDLLRLVTEASNSVHAPTPSRCTYSADKKTLYVNFPDDKLALAFYNAMGQSIHLTGIEVLA